jgi:hypothetical protein
MADEKDVAAFLRFFKEKLTVWGVLYRDDRGKNAQTLAELELRPMDRDKVLEKLKVDDYSEGPKPEMQGLADMWVFGKQVKGQEIYIKITLGFQGQQVLCISFHIAEYPMNYPLKR